MNYKFQHIFLFVIYSFIFFIALTWQPVAHLAYPGVKKFELLLFVTGAIAGLVFYRHSILLFLVLGFLTPRLFSILTNTPTHSFVFPQILGLGLGMYFNRIWNHKLKPVNKDMETGTLMYLLLLFSIYGIVLFFRLYTTEFFTHGMLDHEIRDGISANYSWYLGASLYLNLAAPLLFVFIHKITRPNDLEKPEYRLNQLAIAFIIIAAFNIIASIFQYLGYMRFGAGAGDWWKELGRLIGVFTDSGSSSILLPFILFTSFFGWIYLAKSLFNTNNKLIVYSVPLLCLICLAAFSLFSGKLYIITVLCNSLVVVVYIFKDHLRKKILHMFFIAIIFIICLFLINYKINIFRFNQVYEETFTLISSFIVKMSQGDFFSALQAIDKFRYQYYSTGFQIFKDHPIFGSGINSFMTLYHSYNSTKIPIDNPGGLLIGLLSDFGMMAMTILAAWSYLMYKTWLNFNATYQGNQVAQQRLVKIYFLLVLTLLIPSFFGYHILYPEYCVLICSVFLLASEPASFQKTKNL